MVTKRLARFPSPEGQMDGRPRTNKIGEEDPLMTALGQRGHAFAEDTESKEGEKNE